jgi:membrane protease YdiL (CAAX protease family)
MQKTRFIVVSIAIVAIWLFFGYAISRAGFQVLLKWSSIGAAYAAVGALWSLAGPVMFGAGLWVLGSLGRHRMPLWLGGTAGVLAGAALVVGVLTYVVPCSGPS